MTSPFEEFYEAYRLFEVTADRALRATRFALCNEYLPEHSWNLLRLQ